LKAPENEIWHKIAGEPNVAEETEKIGWCLGRYGIEVDAVSNSV